VHYKLKKASHPHSTIIRSISRKTLLLFLEKSTEITLLPLKKTMTAQTNSIVHLQQNKFESLWQHFFST